jgi:hypothetical protein
MSKVSRKSAGATTPALARPVATLAAQAERVLAARAEIERLVDGSLTVADRVHARSSDGLLYEHQQRLIGQILTTKAESLAGAAAQIPIATAFVEELFDSYSDDSPEARRIIGMLRLALYSISAVVHAEAGLSRETPLPTYFMPARDDPHDILAAALSLR